MKTARTHHDSLRAERQFPTRLVLKSRLSRAAREIGAQQDLQRWGQFQDAPSIGDGP
jgi:hypothetical protein